MTDNTPGSIAQSYEDTAEMLIQNQGRVMNRETVPNVVFEIGPDMVGKNTILEERHAPPVIQFLQDKCRRAGCVPLALAFYNGCLLTPDFVNRLLGPEMSKMCRESIEHLVIHGGTIPDGDDGKSVLTTLLYPFTSSDGNNLVGADFSGLVFSQGNGSILHTIAQALHPGRRKGSQKMFKALFMHNCGICDSKARDIAAGIISPNYQSLETLCLLRNNITPGGADIVGGVLEKCFNLKRIEIEVHSKTNEGAMVDSGDEEDADQADGYSILKALSKIAALRKGWNLPPILERLILKNTQVNLKAMKVLGDVIESSVLTYLDVSGSSMSNDTVSLLLQSIHQGQNVKLIHLDLSDIKLSGKNVKLLTKLFDGDTLVKLHTNYCEMTNSSFHRILNKAQEAPTMKELHCKGNKITWEGMALLLQPSHKFMNLEFMDLSENCYGGTSKENLSEIMKKYPSVKIGYEDGVYPEEDDESSDENASDSSDDDGGDEDTPPPPVRRPGRGRRGSGGRGASSRASSRASTRASSYSAFQNESDEEASDESSVHENPRTVRIRQATTVWTQVLNHTDHDQHATRIELTHFPYLFRGAMRENNANSTVPADTCDEYANLVADGRDYITLERWVEFWLRYNKVAIEEDDDDDVDGEEEDEDLR